MLACSKSPAFVTFRGGFVADETIVRRLWDLQARGCSFQLEGGGQFRVVPPDRLTVDDVAFLRQRRDEARQVIAYVADDSHLFTDQSQAQPERLPEDEPQRRTA